MHWLRWVLKSVYGRVLRSVRSPKDNKQIEGSPNPKTLHNLELEIHPSPTLPAPLHNETALLHLNLINDNLRPVILLRWLALPFTEAPPPYVLTPSPLLLPVGPFGLDLPPPKPHRLPRPQTLKHRH